MTDTIARILSGGAFTRQQADALRQLLAAAAGAGLGTMATQNANAVAITGGTIGGVVFNALNQGNGFISWTGEATVTPSTSVALLDSTGAALSPAKTYKVAACNIDSSAQRGAVALFVGNGSSFTVKTVYEQGTTSSNVQLYLNAGVPSVSVYGGSGSYRIPYRIEEVPNFGQGLSEFGILQRITDAPSDGKIYGRKDAMWVEAGSGGGKTLKQQEFKTSGTWTRPAGVNSVEVLLVGGGGGGGASDTSTAGGGGGGGQVIREVVPVTGNVSVLIGSGGAGGVPPTTHGTQGGSTSFGSAIAYGGGGGATGSAAAATPVGGGSGGGSSSSSSSSPAPGVGRGSSSGGTLTINGNSTVRKSGSGGGAGGTAMTQVLQTGGTTSVVAPTPVGGVGLYGFGGGGGGAPDGLAAHGGGAGGSTNSGGTYGYPGAANTGGGGGGGGGANKNGGAGGSGICIVTWWE